MSQVSKVNYWRIGLLVILFFAFLVRVWGIDFGLPQTGTRHDESTIVNIAMSFGRGDFNPHFFHYPTFLMYVLFTLYTAYYFVGLLVGRFADLGSFVAEFSLNPTNFYLTARMVSVIAGVATVAVTYKVSRVLLGKKIALVSAFFLSLAYLAVRESHFGKVDTLGTLFIMSAFLFIVQIIKDKSVKNYMLAGLFGGLAMSTRYAGALVVFPMIVVQLADAFSKRRGRVKIFFNKNLRLFFVVLLLTFAASTPFAVLDFKTFISEIAELNNLISQPWYGVEVGGGWSYHLRVSLMHGLGWSLFLSSLTGLVLLFVKDMRKALVLIAFPLVYYFFIGRAWTAVVRYSLPLVPFFCVTGAVFIVEASEKLKRYVNPGLRRWVLVLITGLVIFPSAVSVLKFNKLMAVEDSRLLATEWINENLSEGSSIFQTGSWLGQVQLFESVESLERQLEEFEGEEHGNKRLALQARMDYLQSGGAKGFDQWEYEEERQRFFFEGEKMGHLPQYIILYETSVGVDKVTSPISEYVIEILEESYSLVKSFDVVDVENSENVYDQQDAFYLPYSGFEGVERPGPNIYIYENLG